jgi:hypothetical protein
MREDHLIIGYKLTTYKHFWVALGLLLGILYNGPLDAQGMRPDEAIKALREGYLIIRLPSYRAKIDTLESLLLRTPDANHKLRLQRLLNETVETRDSLRAGYLRAFKTQYHFSKVVWFNDYEARDPEKATYYTVDGEPVSRAEFKDKPVFYLFFERTAESRIEGLVIYDQSLTMVPRPFPNNFTRGGLNFLFLKISEKNFPAWRVSKMQKQLIKYYNAIRMMEESESKGA